MTSAPILRRLGALPAPLRLLMAVATGALLSCGNEPIALPWVAFAALPAIAALVVVARRPFWAGWGAGFGYFVVSLHWMGHAFLVDAERFAWMMPFAITLMPAGLATFWGLAAWATGRWARGTVLFPVGLAAAIAAAEMTRSFVLTGFPWALPAYAWIDTPVAQAAAWAGPHGLTLLVLLVALLPGWALLRPGRGAAVLAVLALAGGAGLWLAGGARLAAHPSAQESDRPLIRVVQPNAPQTEKWREAMKPTFQRRLLELTAEPAEDGPLALVIWPETAFTWIPADRHTDLLAQMAEVSGVLLVSGGIFMRRDGETRLWFNGLMLLGPGGQIEARYDKHHLVPFGEYLPLKDLLSRVGIAALAQMSSGGFAAGPGPRLLQIPGLPSVQPLICYEMIFPHEILRGAERPGWLLHLTNDAWFGSWAGPQQHLDQARMRAIEFGLPVIRTANTGISAAIDPVGRIVSAIRLGVASRMDVRLPMPIPETLYARHGDIPAGLIMLASFAMAVLSGRIAICKNTPMFKA